MDQTLDEWADTLQKTALDTWEATGELPSVYVNVWRDDEHIFTFMCRDNDTAMYTTYISCVGMQVDRAAVTFEGWTTTGKVNPDTGNKWSREELESYLKDHQETGVVTSAVFTYAVTRDGDQATRAHRVFVTEEGNLFEDICPTKGEQAKGTMADWMTTVMMETPIDERMQNDGWTPEEVDEGFGGHAQRMVVQDKAVLDKLVSEKVLDGMMFISEEGTDRNKLLNELLGSTDRDINFLTSEEFIAKFS